MVVQLVAGALARVDALKDVYVCMHLLIITWMMIMVAIGGGEERCTGDAIPTLIWSSG